MLAKIKLKHVPMRDMARRYCGRFLGSTKFSQMIDDKGVVDGRNVMGAQLTESYPSFRAPTFSWASEKGKL